jgi:hypothetical protein
VIPAALEQVVYIVGAFVIVAAVALFLALLLLLAYAAVRPRPKRAGRIA